MSAITTKDLPRLSGTATRAEILNSLLRYAIRNDLLKEGHMIHPDVTLGELLGTTEPLHIKDLYFSLRTHNKQRRNSL